MLNILKDVRNIYSNSGKKIIIIRLILSALVIAILVAKIVERNYSNVFSCVLTLILFVLPTLLQIKFKIVLPSVLEIIILCFIFSAQILGNVYDFYDVIPCWDMILHTTNGFIAAGSGFSIIDILNKNANGIKLSALCIAITAFCFSMTVGALWEIFEYSTDKIFVKDTQRDEVVNKISSVDLYDNKNRTVVTIDNIEYTIIYSTDKDGNIIKTVIDGGYLDIGLNDTIQDLIADCVGAIVFSILGYLYILNIKHNKYLFIGNFIPKRKSKNSTN